MSNQLLALMVLGAEESVNRVLMTPAIPINFEKTHHFTRSELDYYVKAIAHESILYVRNSEIEECESFLNTRRDLYTLSEEYFFEARNIRAERIAKRLLRWSENEDLIEDVRRFVEMDKMSRERGRSSYTKYYAQHPETVKKVWRVWKDFALLGEPSIKKRYDEGEDIDEFASINQKLFWYLEHFETYRITGLPILEYLDRFLIAIFEYCFLVEHNGILRRYGFSPDQRQQIKIALSRRQKRNKRHDKEKAIKIHEIVTDFSIPYSHVAEMLHRFSGVMKCIKPKSQSLPFLFRLWLLKNLRGKDFDQNFYRAWRHVAVQIAKYQKTPANSIQWSGPDKQLARTDSELPPLTGDDRRNADAIFRLVCAAMKSDQDPELRKKLDEFLKLASKK